MGLCHAERAKEIGGCGKTTRVPMCVSWTHYRNRRRCRAKKGVGKGTFMDGNGFAVRGRPATSRRHSIERQRRRCRARCHSRSAVVVAEQKIVAERLQPLPCALALPSASYRCRAPPTAVRPPRCRAPPLPCARPVAEPHLSAVRHHLAVRGNVAVRFCHEPVGKGLARRVPRFPGWRPLPCAGTWQRLPYVLCRAP